MKRVYMDHAATTAVRPEVLEAMLPYFSEHYGNASSVYSLAKDSRNGLETARKQVAKALNAEPSEVFFTGCGSESDNWALVGAAEALEKKGRHIITSAIEHHAILHTCQYLETRGFEVTYLPVDADGLVRPEDLEAAIRPDTVLVSIMFANNEIGTIEPIEELAAIAHRHGVYFHTDAVQAVGHVPIDVQKMGIDLLSLSGHKLGAAKGVGALYIKKGIAIRSFLHGGGQEKGRRAGTENLAGIVGLGKAIELAIAEMDAEAVRLTVLRDRLIQGILEAVPHTRLNGHPTKRLPGNVNVAFEFIEGESMLLLLDMYGICASSGSACTSGSLDPSHVLLAIGLPHEKAHGSLRLTLGEENTQEDVDFVINTLPPIVERLRSMSPLYEEYLKKH